MATRKPVARKIATTRTRAKPATAAENTRPVPLDVFSDRRMERYAVETITERAIPDIADGLKPVQRRVLYAASRIALNGTVKTARLIGDTLGKYHPHGDTSVSDAIYQMVTIHPTPMLRGTGNWGTLIDSQAAPRYTNVGVSAYGRMFCQPDYLNETVTAFVPNYDDEEIEPVMLPAPLPNILMTGMEGIAVGAATHLPAFTPESIVAVLVRILKGEKLTPSDYARMLKPALVNGGSLVNTPKNKQQWLQLMTSNKARIEYEGQPKVDAAKRQMVLDQWPPGSNPEAIMEKVRALEECGKVWTSEGAVTFTVPMKTGYNTQQFQAFVEKVSSLCRSAVSYNLNVTHREVTVTDGIVKYDTKLMSMTVPQMFTAWLKIRHATEIRSLDYRIKKLQEQMDYTNLMLYAMTILDVIRKAWDAPDFRAYLCKHSKCTPEQAAILGGFKVEQLGKLSKATWNDKLREQKAVMAQLKKWRVNPKPKILQDVQDCLAKMKSGNKEDQLTLA